MEIGSTLKALGMTLGLCAMGACAENDLRRVGPPTPQAQSMDRAMADVNRIRAYVNGGGRREDTVAAAADLQAWAGALPAVFPRATAAQYVDLTTQQAGRASQAMTETAHDLSIAAASADRTAVAAALDKVERQGCGACHLTAAR